MDDLRKKILLDLCVTPGTVIPTALGVSLLMLSVVLGSGAAFIGFLCCLVGFGALLTNFVFRLGSVSQQAAKEWQKQQQRKRDKELDDLDSKLARTKETKDEIALRNLRALYTSFCKDYEAGRLARSIPPLMLQTIDEIFESCVHQLVRTVELYEQARQVQGDLKKELRRDRAELLKGVEGLVEELAHAINEVRALKVKATKGELQSLQRRLASQRQVARATEERVMELDHLGEDPDKYSEYLDE